MNAPHRIGYSHSLLLTLNTLRQELVLQNMFMYEDEDTSCCEAQDMSLVDDVMSDMKETDILVPQVVVSCSVFVLFFLLFVKVQRNLCIMTFETEMQHHLMKLLPANGDLCGKE